MTKPESQLPHPAIATWHDLELRVDRILDILDRINRRHSWSDIARCGHNSCQHECKFFPTITKEGK